MLPHAEKTGRTAMIILLSTFLIIPAGFLLYNYKFAGIHVTWMVALAGAILLFYSYRLYMKKTDRTAVGLMLSSFVYLPFILIVLVLERFL